MQVDQKPQERKLVDQDSSKSTVATSDDGKSQPEDSMENLYILRFTRCPREFREALLEGPLLQDCQDSMKSVGLEAEMPTGSKIFCKPGLHKNAMEAVRRTFPNLEDSLERVKSSEIFPQGVGMIALRVLPLCCSRRSQDAMSDRYIIVQQL